MLICASVSLKLVYFPVRGRGQAVKYLCLDNGLQLEEDVVTGEKWPEVKPTTPFGQLPVLKDGSFDIPQSNAILRHLARKHGLYGKNEVEATKVDMLNDQQEDLRLAYLQMIYRDYELGKDGFIKKLPDQLKIFEEQLSKNNGGKGYFVGDGITFVDYTIFDLLDNLLTLCPSCLDPFPVLKEFYHRMESKDKIHKHRQSEAFKKLPINGNGKQ